MFLKKTIDLTFTLLNAENLFLLFDRKPELNDLKLDEQQWKKLSVSTFPNKPISKCRELAKSIQEMNPDILLLCEVGGLESLNNFNFLFLNNEYSSALIEGNSDRNIDVGFLIKKNLPFYFDLSTNKNRPINYLYPSERSSKNPPVNKLSRDCAELRLFKTNRDTPFLNILLTHLKSRLDPEKKDPNGFERRQAELKTVLEIQSEIQLKYPDTPLILAGDFNGNASRLNTEEEFKIIYSQYQLEDALQLGQIPAEKRFTFYQIKNYSKNEGKQIDYCFLNTVCAKYLDLTSPYIYRYKDVYGFELDIPQSIEKKFELPSDHYPLTFKLKDLPIS